MHSCYRFYHVKCRSFLYFCLHCVINGAVQKGEHFTDFSWVTLSSQSAHESLWLYKNELPLLLVADLWYSVSCNCGFLVISFLAPSLPDSCFSCTFHESFLHAIVREAALYALRKEKCYNILSLGFKFYLLLLTKPFLCSNARIEYKALTHCAFYVCIFLVHWCSGFYKQWCVASSSSLKCHLYTVARAV